MTEKKWVTKKIKMGNFGRVVNLVLDVEGGGRYTYIEKENDENKNKKIDFEFHGYTYEREGKKVLEDGSVLEIKRIKYDSSYMFLYTLTLPNKQFVVPGNIKEIAPVVIPLYIEIESTCDSGADGLYNVDLSNCDFIDD